MGGGHHCQRDWPTGEETNRQTDGHRDLETVKIVCIVKKKVIKYLGQRIWQKISLYLIGANLFRRSKVRCIQYNIKINNVKLLVFTNL